MNVKIKYKFKSLANNQGFEEVFALEQIECVNGGFIEFIKSTYGKSIRIISREIIINESEKKVDV